MLKLFTREHASSVEAGEIVQIASGASEALGSAMAYLPDYQLHFFVCGNAGAAARAAIFRLGKELEANIESVAVGAVIGPRVDDLDGYRRATRDLGDAARMTFYSPIFDVVPSCPPSLRPLNSEEALSLTLEMRRLRTSAGPFVDFLRNKMPHYGLKRHIDPDSLSSLLKTWMSEFKLHSHARAGRNPDPGPSRPRPATVFDYCEDILRGAGVCTDSSEPMRRLEIHQVQLWVSEHIGEELTLAPASEEVGLTLSYLGTLFKQTTGLSFKEFVTRVRMEWAGRLLRETNLLVYEVAARVGIPNYRYFGKVFHQNYGMSPNEYPSG